MAEINPELQEYIRELDNRNASLIHARGSNKLTDEELERLLSYGVAIPYADAYSFNEAGMLLVGEESIDKQSSVRRISELYPRRFQLLAQDNPVIYQPKINMNPVVYLDDIRSEDVPFFVPFLFPGSVPEFPVEYLFHLKRSDRRATLEGDMSEAINFMMFEAGFYRRTRANERRLNEIFSQVRCYDVLRPGW